MRNLVFIALCLLISEVQSQSLALDTIKISSAKIDYTPSIAQYSEEFKTEKGSNLSLGDFFDSKTSYFINSHGPSGIQTISLRGTGSQHSKIYWNGFRIESPTLGLTDLSTVSASLMESIDVHPGLSSLIDGSGGLGGAVHLQSGLFADTSLVRLGFDLSTIRNTGGYIHVNLLGKILDYSLKFQHTQGENKFTFKRNNQIGHPLDTIENAGFQNNSILQHLRFNINSKNTIKLSAWLSELDRQLPDIGKEDFGTDNLNDRSSRIALNYVYSKENMVLEWRSYFSDEKQIATLDEEYLVKFHTSQNALQFNYYPNKLLLLKTSIEYSYTEAFADGYPNGKALNQYAAFANGRITPHSRVLFDLLIRSEINGDNFAPIMPSAHFAFQLNSTLSLRGGAALAYRFPSLNDLYWQDVGNPDLTPEKGWTSELGYTFTSSLKSIEIKWDVQTFLGEINDWILWTPAGNIWSPKNIRKVQNRGIENRLNLMKKVGAGKSIAFKMAHTFVQTTHSNKEEEFEDIYGKQLIYIPENKVNLGISVSKDTSWETGFMYRYTDKRYVLEDHSAWMPSYELIDFWVSKQIPIRSKSIYARMGIDNILNTPFQVTPQQPMPGRVFKLQITYKHN